MTIAKDFASKLAVAFVATAMILTMFAPSAKAQTTEDLQKMINDLLAKVAGLQAQVGQGGSSVASGICPYTWTRDLSSGSTGADVMKLQQFLNANEDTRVAASGAGSVGAETQYYGPATAAAVSKFQVMYRSEVLTGLVNPTGYFGPASRAKANSLCTSGSGSNDDDDDDNGSVSLSGEADLESIEVEDADDSSVQEGDEEVEVAIVTVEFENGDAEISRLDVKLDHDTSSRPWNAFESFSLWVDGDMIAEADASSKSDYIGSNDDMIRFSGLDLVAEEDEELEIVIAATLKSSIKDADRGDWTISVESIRYFDADGVASTEAVTGESAEFTVELAGADDDVNIKRSSSDPKESTLKVETNTSKQTHSIGAFVVEVGEDSSDVIVNDGKVSLIVKNKAGSSQINSANVIDKVAVKLGGKTFTGKIVTGSGAHGTIDNGATRTLIYDVDFKELDLDADEDHEAEIEVTFKGQDTGSNYADGVTIYATTTGSFWDVEGVDPIDVSGSYTGKVHTLNGSDVAFSGYAWTVNNVGSLLDFTFTVEADDGSFDVLSASIASTTSGNATISAGVLSVVSGDATSISGGFTVEEGDTATFRVRYTVTGANGTSREVKITSVAGQTVPTDKQVSPTATRNVQS